MLRIAIATVANINYYPLSIALTSFDKKENEWWNGHTVSWYSNKTRLPNTRSYFDNFKHQNKCCYNNNELTQVLWDNHQNFVKELWLVSILNTISSNDVMKLLRFLFSKEYNTQRGAAPVFYKRKSFQDQNRWSSFRIILIMKFHSSKVAAVKPRCQGWESELRDGNDCPNNRKHVREFWIPSNIHTGSCIIVLLDKCTCVEVHFVISNN